MTKQKEKARRLGRARYSLGDGGALSPRYK